MVSLAAFGGVQSSAVNAAPIWQQFGRPALRRSYLRACVAVVVLSIVSVACSGGATDNATPVTDPPRTTQQVPLGNPGTLVAPASTTAPQEFTLSVETVVAILNSCAPDAELVGACRCALDRIEGNLADGDIVVFEDRFSGRNEFSPELAAALTDCSEAPPVQAWSSASVNTFVVQCMRDNERLRDLCLCASERAEEILPEARIREYGESNDMVPNFVELINGCI
ncbi:MAG: hypothetical protein ACI91O_001708 [Candidatus Poriferisodalaceae bacterium]|jgi:hypothetical protein